MNIEKLSPQAKRAAMKSGVDSWGEYGCSSNHARYAQPISPRSRRRCQCGCKRRETHVGMANGVALMGGCEMSVYRWVKNGWGDAL